ncbi:class I SAM-dependent methyltransferase, partial [Sphingomonas bacterium]|uniref:class I SAM-dependent methyltransferase n=1 Tax=Sphingomonas bacterium TaxID=1895847 RepID=UPI0015771A17
APAGGGRAVDLGCGAGTTALTLAAARPDLSITGVDLSPELIRVASGRNSLSFLHFEQADLAAAGARHVAGADLLFSRHGVMFFDDPATVFTSLRQGAAPGARLVFSCFRAPDLNSWATLATVIAGTPPSPPRTGYAPGPFGFADAAWTESLLARAGWVDIHHEPADYRYIAGEGADPVADAIGFLRRIGPVASALHAVPDQGRPAALDRLTTALAAHRDGDRVDFPAAASIWTARA